ncbi:MAG: 30S ribosomal protein S16 [Elusimicrobia bacterium]|nr:30S ribosomal protein S16 [Elusimicrobiota bacterium]
MLRIRLKRMGRRHTPFFRIVVIPSERRRDGRVVEEIGWWDPARQTKNFEINLDRANYWISKGAQPSDTVKSIIKKAEKGKSEEK